MESAIQKVHIVLVCRDYMSLGSLRKGGYLLLLFSSSIRYGTTNRSHREYKLLLGGFCVRIYQRELGQVSSPKI
jgi:hypothetical protein